MANVKTDFVAGVSVRVRFDAIEVMTLHMLFSQKINNESNAMEQLCVQDV